MGYLPRMCGQLTRVTLLNLAPLPAANNCRYSYSLDRILCPPPMYILRLPLAWARAGILHAVTTTASSCLQLAVRLCLDDTILLSHHLLLALALTLSPLPHSGP